MSNSVREGRVVVRSAVTMMRNEEHGVFSASFEEMGVTGFGKTPDEALHELKMVFRTYIRACREHGLLEKNLNRLGVDWAWESEYPGEYEDTDPVPASDEEPWQRIQKRILTSATWNLMAPTDSADAMAA